MSSQATACAQSGLFRFGNVELPTLQAIIANTVLVDTIDALAPMERKSLTAVDGSADAPFYYGTIGTPTTSAAECAIARLEGGSQALLTPSGQSAIALVLSTLLQPGDHLLAVDTATYSTRWYIDRRLAATGVDVTYYSPESNEDIISVIRPTTRVIFLESPGSMTFELQDVAEITQVARERTIATVLDNTWAASKYFRPFKFGVDFSVLSLSKYHAALSGVSLGAIVTTKSLLHEQLKEASALFGLSVSPAAVADAIQALTTLDIRLNQQENAIAEVIAGLRGHPVIATLFHPSVPGHSGYEIWRRDYCGANSLISISFCEQVTLQDLKAAIDRFRVIRIGYGWGGALSLATVFIANESRSVSKCKARGACLRLYVGLEEPHDVLQDLLRAFDGMPGAHR